MMRRTTPSVGRPTPPAGDPLASLVVERLREDPDNPARHDVRYLEWLARDLDDESRRAARRVPDARYAAQGRALMAAVHARQLAFTRYDGAPPQRTARVRATPSAALVAALAHRATPLVDLAVAAGAGRDLWDEVCDQWIVLPDDMPAGRYLSLRIRGDSMAPVIPSGATVLVRLDAHVQPATVVIARHPDDGYVCKRVREVTPTTILLDSLAPDGPAFLLERTPDVVLGTVLAVWTGR